MMVSMQAMMRRHNRSLVSAPAPAAMVRMLKGGSSVGSSAGGEQDEWDSGQACNPELPSQPQCAPGYTCAYFDMNPRTISCHSTTSVWQ